MDVIYTYSTESFLNNNTAKYIDIESNTNEKLDNFLIGLQNIHLTTNLNQNPFSNPSKNYDKEYYIKQGLNLTKRNIKNLR